MHPLDGTFWLWLGEHVHTFFGFEGAWLEWPVQVSRMSAMLASGWLAFHSVRTRRYLLALISLLCFPYYLDTIMASQFLDDPAHYRMASVLINFGLVGTIGWTYFEQQRCGCRDC